MEFSAGFNADLIVNNLQEGRVVTSGGVVSYEGAYNFEVWESVIITALAVPNDTNPFLLKSAVRKAIFSNALGQDFSANALLSEVGKQLALIKKVPTTRYEIFLELTMQGAPPAAWLQMTKCRVYFAPKLNSRRQRTAILERQKLLDEYGDTYGLLNRSEGLMPVIVKTTAHSPHEAFSIAENAIDEMRGLINLFLNRQVLSRKSFGQPRQPVNELRWGPLHTIHDENGHIPNSLFWYEPNWTKPRNLVSLKKIKSSFSSDIINWNRHIRTKNLMRENALDALRQYCRALDQTVWQHSFLALWSTLEFLTNTNNADYNKLVERAAAAHNEHTEMRQMANHLRLRRNSIVHSPHSISNMTKLDHEAEELIFQVKLLVEPLIILFLRNSFKFENREQLSQFLDAPRSKDAIELKLRILNSALKFRSRANAIQSA
jgi:hypothetical protein